MAPHSRWKNYGLSSHRLIGSDSSPSAANLLQCYEAVIFFKRIVQGGTMSRALKELPALIDPAELSMVDAACLGCPLNCMAALEEPGINGRFL